LLVAWDPCLFALNPSLSCGGLLLQGHCLATNTELALLNVYGPCTDKVIFWSHLAASGILSLKNLIIGGDLNLFFEAEESWGGVLGSEPTGARFKEIFDSNFLINIRPSILSPTWRNGRMGPSALARRLDRFYVAAALLASSGQSSSWVVSPFFSDHAPIVLQLRLSEPPKPAPFKFNHSCLALEDYIQLVNETWTDHRFTADVNPQTRRVWKLQALKSKTKHWFHMKSIADQSSLLSLESEISKLTLSSTKMPCSDDTDRLKRLEANRANLLKAEEFAWRLRSRETWLRSGDSNSKYFHKVASYNRQKKNDLVYKQWRFRDPRAGGNKG